LRDLIPQTAAQTVPAFSVRARPPSSDVTVNTGQGAVRITDSATLPMSK
jgi:hypothetical protein